MFLMNKDIIRLKFFFKKFCCNNFMLFKGDKFFVFIDIVLKG